MKLKALNIRTFFPVAAVVFLCVVAATHSAAQQPMVGGQRQAIPGAGSNQNISDPYGDMRRVGGNPFESGAENNANGTDNALNATRDTTKRKPRKPLESYFFDDSTRMRPNFAWNVDMARNRLKMIDIDTAMLGAQLDYPYLREDVGDAIIGPLGAGTIPINAGRRPQFRDWEFAQALYSYFYDPENAPFYNVKKPFTHLSYFTAGQKKYAEETLWATHAQNISPSTGFNANYRVRSARGIYAWQATRNRALSLAFNHTGKRYSIHAGYIYNMADLRENGGLVSDSSNQVLTSPISKLPENLPVRMTDARNLLKNNRYYLVQSFGFPLGRLSNDDMSIAGKPSVFFGNSIDYSRFWRKYTDTYANTLFTDPITNTKRSYYENWNISSTMSRDSIFESRLSARLFMQIQPWNRESIVGVLDAGVGVDNHQYYMFDMSKYLAGFGGRDVKNSWYIYGGAGGQFRKYMQWDAKARYVYGGYRSGDVDLTGNIDLSAFLRGRPITVSGAFTQSLSSPGYWTDNFFSNHFAWNNSFSKESLTRIDLGLKIPDLGFGAGVFQSLWVDKIYYGADCKPAQYGGSLSLSGLYIEENIPLWNLHLNHRVVVQSSSNNNVVPVPMTSAYLSYFYEFNVVKGVLRMQIGLDGWYTTSYYGFGYNPATMQFYNQREKKVGDFPMVDAFINAKWKRMRIILKMTHLNQGIIGSDLVFDVVHYPLNARVFKIGISWTFYD